MTERSERESTERERSRQLGYLYAGTGFFLWGVLPIFWKRLAHLPAPQILCHRVIWSLVFLSLLLVIRASLLRVPSTEPPLRVVVRDAAVLRMLTVTALLISVNWGLYIWAVNVGRILQASLGYYICPLVSMVLGVVFLGERIRGLRIASVAIVAVTVGWFVARQGEVPWIALGIAFSWGFYSLVRKQVRSGAFEGLYIETVLLTPIAGAYLLWCSARGESSFLHGQTAADLLLFSTGAVTTIPLLFYNAGVRRIPLTSIALMQYMTPTISFLLAVFLYGEVWTTAHLFLFAGIWLGLGLHTWAGFRETR